MTKIEGNKPVLSTQPIVDLLKKNPQGIRYIAEISGDRHILDVPIDLIEKHPALVTIRGKDPSDLSLLRDSMKKTAGPVYMPCVYIEKLTSNLAIYVGDGHQRLQSAKENGDERITVQYMAAWENVKAALEGAVSVQYARYETTEQDVVSLIRSGELLQAQIARLTGYDESRVSRLAKVASPEVAYLYTAVRQGVIGLGMAGRLVDACGENRDKMTALQNTFTGRYDEAEQKAKFWDNKIKSSKKKWDKKTKDKARIATYFRDIDWSVWADALEDDDGIENKDGQLMLSIDGAGSRIAKSGIRIGDASEWSKEYALYGLFGKKIEEVDPKDLDEVLDDWDYVRTILEAIRDSRPVPAKNPVIEPQRPEPPAQQQPPMTVKRPRTKAR
jgi:plasmid maintenance system antidote protein VapI